MTILPCIHEIKPLDMGGVLKSFWHSFIPHNWHSDFANSMWKKHDTGHINRKYVGYNCSKTRCHKVNSRKTLPQHVSTVKSVGIRWGFQVVRFTQLNKTYKNGCGEGVFKVWKNILVPQNTLNLEKCNNALDMKFHLPEEMITETTNQSLSASQHEVNPVFQMHFIIVNDSAVLFENHPPLPQNVIISGWWHTVQYASMYSICLFPSKKL